MDEFQQDQKITLKDLILEFAGKTSMSALPFIESSSGCCKGFWSAVFVVAFIATVAHIVIISLNFAEFQKHAKVVIVSEEFEFPAVTFCNVNPMRLSQKDKAKEALRSLIDSIHPDAILKSIGNHTTNFYLNGTFADSPPSLDKIYNFLQWDNKSYTDINECPNCTQDASPGLSGIDVTFWDNFVLLNESTRRAFGHQLEDMLLKCIFAFDFCVRSHFKQMLDYVYGNCYTWQHNNSTDHHRGRDNGLLMTVYLETDDYIPGVADGHGVRLIVHEQNTLPNPWDEGILLPGGTASTINLKMTKLVHLNSWNDPCVSTNGYQEKFGFKYSRNVCDRLCFQKFVREKCECINGMEPEINNMLQNPLNLRTCSYSNNSDLDCIYQDFDFTSCGCVSPCMETIYSKEVSQVNWPTSSFQEVLIEKVCQRMSNESCQKIKSKSKEQLTRDFLQVEIYFESSNYEEFIEEEDYMWYTMLSDVGGSIGLWLGFTAVTIIEVVYLLCTCAMHLKRKFKTWINNRVRPV